MARNAMTATIGDVTSRPMGIAESGLLYGAFSLLLWLAVSIEIPWLHEKFGIPTIIGWYFTGTAFVLLPILVFGVVSACLELPIRNLGTLCKRLRVHKMNPADARWTIAGLGGVLLGSAILALFAQKVNPAFRASPDFLRQPPGLHIWVVAEWIPLFMTNILGEELCWRGYVLPRQEASLGRTAWLLNGGMWCLFHWSFGLPVLLLLLPVALLLPWIVQRRSNTSIGIIIHGLFNAAGFIFAVSGRSNL
jgi:membrane protease YdiL (CAAX protease family)